MAKANLSLYKNEYLLIYLSKAIAIFHLCLYYKFDVFGQPLSNLVFLGALKPADADRIKAFLTATTPAVSELETKHPFELVMTGEATVEGQAVTVTVHLMDRHTNVVSVDRNGENLTDRYLYGESLVHTEPADRSLLNVQDIIT